MGQIWTPIDTLNADSLFERVETVTPAPRQTQGRIESVLLPLYRPRPRYED